MKSFVFIIKTFGFSVSVIVLLFFGYHFVLANIPSEDNLSIQIVDETAEKLKTKISNLHLCGWGGQQISAQVVYMGFQINHEIDLNSGRDLILQITNTYIDAFNSNKKFRPFIREYPFTIKNLHIDIYFSTPTRGNISDGKISIISINRGIIKYKGGNPDDRLPDGGSRHMTIHEESYEEAMHALSGSPI